MVSEVAWQGRINVSESSRELIFEIIFGSGALGGRRDNDLNIGEEIPAIGSVLTGFTGKDEVKDEEEEEMSGKLDKFDSKTDVEKGDIVGTTTGK